MNFTALLLNSLWAALFAIALAFLFSAPYRALLASFYCGFLARFVRDVLMGWSGRQNLSIFIAAAIVMLVAIVATRRRAFSPIVAVAGIVPLGAAGALFRAIVAFLQVSSMKGDALAGAPVALISNLSIVFTTTCAIALGAWAGYLVAQSVRRTEPV